MAGAKLTRIDAVEQMAAAVDVFRTEAAAALEELDMEVRRALEWIHHDRHDHWNHEVRRGWERVTESRIELQQAMTARRIGDRDPSCVDEKKALERAKRRLDVAQEKVEAVRHWTHSIDHAVTEYHGSRAQLSGWLDAEVPKALAALRRMTAALETYVTIPAPESVVQPSRLPSAGETPASQKGVAGETSAPQSQEAAP